MRIIFNNLQSRAKCTQEERSLIKNGRREGEGDSIFFLRLLIASAIASPRRSSYFLQPSSGFFPPSLQPPYPARYRSFIQLGDTEFALAHSPPPTPIATKLSRLQRSLLLFICNFGQSYRGYGFHFLKSCFAFHILGVSIFMTFSIISNHDDEL